MSKQGDSQRAGDFAEDQDTTETPDGETMAIHWRDWVFPQTLRRGGNSAAMRGPPIRS